MKQLIFMVIVTLAGTLGVFVASPFWGVAVYYFFAVLRPQYLWKWSLPADVSWSFYVAVATILAAVGQYLGILAATPPAEGRNGRGPGFSSTHVWVLLFGVWVSLTYVTATDQDLAYPWFVDYIKLFTMFGVSALLIQTMRQVWTLFILAALSVGYIAYEVNFLYLARGYLGIYKNGYGGLDNNGAGLMLAMGLPLCYFAFEGFQNWARWLFLAFVPVILHAVLMTYSRGAMVSLIVVSPLLLFRSRRRKQVAAVGLVIAILIPVLAGQQIRDRFFSISKHEQDSSAQSRRQSWAAAWGIAKDHPILGVGLRNSGLFTLQYGADMAGRTIHSQYMQVAADNGLVGLAIYLTSFASCWLGLRRVRRAAAKQDSSEAHLTATLASGLECSLAVFCVGSIFLSLELFELPYLLLLMGAQLARVSVFVNPGEPAPDLMETAETDAGQTQRLPLEGDVRHVGC